MRILTLSFVFKVIVQIRQYIFILLSDNSLIFRRVGDDLMGQSILHLRNLKMAVARSFKMATNAKSTLMKPTFTITNVQLAVRNGSTKLEQGVKSLVCEVDTVGIYSTCPSFLP